MCVNVCMHMCGGMWKPWDNSGVLPRVPYTLVFLFVFFFFAWLVGCFKILYFNYMYMCLGGCACEYNEPVEALRGYRIPWGRSYTGILCELPNMCAGNGIQVLYKDRIAFVLTTDQSPQPSLCLILAFLRQGFLLT